jgi:hypothetical protein
MLPFLTLQQVDQNSFFIGNTGDIAPSLLERLCDGNEYTYDYDANWSWDANNGASISVDNHVTGNAGLSTTSSWSLESGGGCGGAFGKGLAAGWSELVYSFSFGFAGADSKDQAWTDAGLDGTWTQTISQGAANVSATAAYAVVGVRIDCFTAGTQIVVGKEFDANDVFVQYVTMNIEDIKVGDLVYSYCTITGETSQKEVTATFSNTSDHINYLTIVDENENVQVIETTDAHPFWVVTDEPDLERAARGLVNENGVWLYHENITPTENGFWAEAKDLLVGDVFLGANGELSTLVDFERVEFPDGIKVYNFTVDGNHNYFVIAKCDEFGQTSILVHNSCSLYRAFDNVTGKIYYGITNNLKRRGSEHARNGITIQPIPLLENVPRNVARAAEQVKINQDGLANLANKINSISPKNQAKFVKEMAEALKLLGGK